MATSKVNYYEILGLHQTATNDEIRRAYRILARRYHPDLNPGKSSEERFKVIALAYQTLSDSEKRQLYDGEIESVRRIKAGFAAYERVQRSGRKPAASEGRYKPGPAPGPSRLNRLSSKTLSQTLVDGFKNASRIMADFSILDSILPKKKKASAAPKENELSTSKVSVIEVSISTQEALFGGRKTVEVPAEPKNKKLSLRIPVGVRTGSVLRLRSGSQSTEDFVIILRVAPHPHVELLPKGVLVDLPVTISEAMFGATIKAPGLEREESLSIPAASQSGQEIRLSNCGIMYEDGHRGDIFYRLNIMIPQSAQAVGLKEKIAAVNEYYDAPVRQGLAPTLKG